MSQLIRTQTFLSNLEASVDKSIETVIEQFQNRSETELLQQPEPNTWCIAQCLWHLNSYALYYNPAIEKAIAHAEPATEFVKPGVLGNYFTRMMQPGKGKYKAFGKHTPPANLNAHETVAAFIQHQETFLTLLRKASHANLNQTKVPISIGKVIRLQLGDVLNFCTAHDQRHIEQALRVLMRIKKE